MKLIKYQFSIKLNGFLLQQQRFILVCKLLKNLVFTKSSSYSHFLLQLFGKQRRIFKKNSEATAIATAMSLPLQMLSHYNCYVTANAIPLQLLCHRNCYDTATAVPLQLPCHYNCYAIATATPLQLPQLILTLAVPKVICDKNGPISCGPTSRTKRIQPLYLNLVFNYNKKNYFDYFI